MTGLINIAGVLAALLLPLQLVGCFYSSAPEPVLKTVVNDCPAVTALPRLPEKMHISVNGLDVKADDAGDAYLRTVIKARKERHDRCGD